jgi:hypothetical protein
MSASVHRSYPGACAVTRASILLTEGSLSVQAISWVLDHSESRLGTRHVLISIANHAKSDGTGAWPSVSTIARESKLSEREVRYALRELEKSGELKTQKGKGPSGCNLYSLPHVRLQGQTLQGQKPTQGGQNPTKTLSDFAPEPKSFKPSLKQPKPRAQSRSARDQFDDEMEQRRRIEERDRRLQRESETRKELMVGSGPR